MRMRKRIFTWGLVAFVAVVVAALVWWILRPEGPEAVDLEAAVARVEAADLPVAGSGAADGNTMAGLEGSVDAATTTSVGTVDSVVTSTTEGSVDAGTTTSVGTVDSVVTSTTEGSVDAGTTTSVGTVDSVVTSSTEAPDDAPSTEIASGAATTLVDAVAEALIGVWTVVISEGADALSAESAVSFAGYRVVEVLAGGVDESTVVGRTAEVAGSIELSGAALVAATVEVEMATLRTDDSHRDSHMRQALNTKEFPLATFTLTEPVELPAGISDGERFSGSVQGDLTIRGVTNRTMFDLDVQLVGDTIVAVGSSDVIFSDFGVTAPMSAAVISVEDHGTMEFQLYFTR